MKNLTHTCGWLATILFLFAAHNSLAVGYLLTVTAQGSGTVIRNPSNASYPAGATVTITATPNSGWYFANWSGDTNGSVNPLNVVMNSSLNITGNFLAYPTYPLTLTTNGQGTIALSPAGGSYQSNTVVTATAAPAGGWLFTGWTGSAAGATNPLSFTMNSANSLTGNFVQLPAFDVQPVGVTNIIGANVSLSAHSAGTVPLAYQWYFNGAGLAGMTNTTLNFNNVQFASAGSYQIIATNLYGSATSSVALLVVTNGFSNPVSVCDEPSLRAAITAGGWIQFGCNGTITLSNPITINNNVILDGSLVNATISGGNAVRLFTVASTGSLTITNLTLANGRTNNFGTGKYADGGAVYNDGGTLNLTGCTLLNNVAYDSFSSGFQGGAFYAARGGAVFNNGGTVTLTGTYLNNNMASGTNVGLGGTGTGYGGAIYMTNGSLTLINCSVSNNTSRSFYRECVGGAICVMTGNVVFSNCQFTANNVSTPGLASTMLIEGGAVALLGGNLTLRQCLFQNNQIADTGSLYVSAIRGGALFCAGTVSMLDSFFLGNQISEAALRGSGKMNAQGGAIYNLNDLTLNGCCIASNLVWGLDGSMSSGGTSQAGDGLGGGIYNAGQLKMTNCTVAWNTAHAGIPFWAIQHSAPTTPTGSAIGAGLYNESNGISLLMNVTLANNTSVTTNQFSTVGFSAGDQIANTNGTLRLHNTLLAYAGTNGNAYGTITDDGYNISSDGSAAFASGTSYNSTDPKLGPLGDNGGPTLTMAQLASSPAIDFGDANGAPGTDQRGFLRPFGAGVDIGAVEYGSSGGTGGITLTVTAQGSGIVIRNPSNSSYPSNVTVTVTATPNAGWYFANWSGDTNGSVNPLNVVMNSSLNITGNFLAYPTYPLTLTTNGQGNIVLSPTGTSFYSNTVVTATATPAVGWVFTGWTGSAAGATNPLSFTMNSANSLTGNFAQLPAFDVLPVGVTNSPGSTVSFFAHAVGTGPLAYQWYFNNALLAGATNTTLAYTNVTFAQAGSYRIVATNNYGSATSSVALLVLTNGSTNPLNVCDEPSLRAAVAKGGWISIGCNGTITLTSPINITNSVILDGSFVNATLSGGGAVRLFNVQPSASLTITNLMLANGLVTNSLSDTNPADGGAIYNNNGTLKLVGCTLANNVVQNKYNNGPFPTIGGFARGGAIFNNGGVVILMGTAVSNNMASAGLTAGTANGGAIYTTNGSLSLTGCSLSRNTCDSYSTLPAAGGAICIVAGNACFNNCNFNTNGAVGSVSGGGGTSFAMIPGTGGAIALLSGSLMVEHCQFFNNLARNGSVTGLAGWSAGGAIYSAATANIANSLFINNSASPPGLAKLPQDSRGGAIHNSGTMQLNGCCICSNFVQGTSGGQFQSGTGAGGNSYGAGVFNAGQLRMTNCTIALNMAQGGFGYSGVTNGAAIGAGICNATNAITICMNVTIASNLCSAAGTGPYGYNPLNGFSAGDQVANFGGTLRLHNTLLAYAGTNGNAYGTITDDGYNISSDGSAALFASGTSYNFTDPKLGPLADNGGPTLTMAPLASSPAIDFGDANGAPHSDQRGLLRPYGDGVDIGAVEYGSLYPAPSPANLLFTHSGPNLLLNFAATPTITYHLQSSTNLTSWVDEETIGAFSSPSNITRTIIPQGNVKKFYRVWYQ